jgi:beta-glucosidase
MVIPDKNLVALDSCPRNQGTWYQEWCWDWASIDTDNLVFPKEFLWGSATSAYQVEGDCTNNTWSELENQKKEDGTPFLPEKSGKACDHWNRYKEDIQLMKKLGLNAYRFSIEWSKVEPEEGTFDQEALTHYADVCDELRQHGI